MFFFFDLLITHYTSSDFFWVKTFPLWYPDFTVMPKNCIGIPLHLRLENKQSNWSANSKRYDKWSYSFSPYSRYSILPITYIDPFNIITDKEIRKQLLLLTKHKLTIHFPHTVTVWLWIFHKQLKCKIPYAYIFFTAF